MFDVGETYTFEQSITRKTFCPCERLHLRMSLALSVTIAPWSSGCISVPVFRECVTNPHKIAAFWEDNWRSWQFFLVLGRQLSIKLEQSTLVNYRCFLKPESIPAGSMIKQNRNRSGNFKDPRSRELVGKIRNLKGRFLLARGEEKQLLYPSIYEALRRFRDANWCMNRSLRGRDVIPHLIQNITNNERIDHPYSYLARYYC